jgi:hypothetical protein
LAVLDTQCRERTSLEWTHDWCKTDPEVLIPSNCSIPEKIIILGFASFHPNGYFREKAVIALSKINNPDSIPFLLIRLNDWVGHVRSISKESLWKLLTPEYATGFIKSLPLVTRLATCGRDNHKEFVASVELLISETKSALLYGITCIDPLIRRICFKIAITSEKFTDSEIVSFVKNEKSGQVRSFALKHCNNRITIDNCKELMSPFLNDTNTRARCLALDLYCKYFLGETMEMLCKQALSNNARVRETSIYYLKKAGVEMSQIYTEMQFAKIPIQW